MESVKPHPGGPLGTRAFRELPMKPHEGKVEVNTAAGHVSQLTDKIKDGKVPVYAGCLARFPRTLYKIAEISAFGAAKHNIPLDGVTPIGGFHDENFCDKYMEAGCRHLLDGAMRDVDPESDHPDIDALIWNLMAVRERQLCDQEEAERQRSKSDD